MELVKELCSSVCTQCLALIVSECIHTHRISIWSPQADHILLFTVYNIKEDSCFRRPWHSGQINTFDCCKISYKCWMHLNRSRICKLCCLNVLLWDAESPLLDSCWLPLFYDTLHWIVVDPLQHLPAVTSCQFYRAFATPTAIVWVLKKNSGPRSSCLLSPSLPVKCVYDLIGYTS